MMTPNEQLVNEIRSRKSQEPWNGGILTADRYVKTIDECVGSDHCYRLFSRGTVSYNDVLTKATKTLTYNNPEMVCEDIYGKEYTWTEPDFAGDERQLTLPKNTLMVFKHVLTTSRRDRDGDIMRTRGAKPDPKMALLWNHVHTLPIGKMLHVVGHTDTKLTLVSALIDINSLAHDSAVMIEAGMGRYSHGFKALEFEKNKEGGGFDIKQFEIMEESLVTVPSNIDAETGEIILGLVESKKLKNPIMKRIGRSLRDKRNKSVSVGTDVGSLKIDVNLSINGQSVESDEHGTKSNDGQPNSSLSGLGKFPIGSKCSGTTGCGCGCGGPGASEKTNADADGEKRTADKEVMLCPKCNERMVDGLCTKCGYRAKETEPTEKGGPGSGRKPGGGRQFPAWYEPHPDPKIARQFEELYFNQKPPKEKPKPTGRVGRALNALRELAGTIGHSINANSVLNAALGAHGLLRRRELTEELDQAAIEPNGMFSKAFSEFVLAVADEEITAEKAARTFLIEADELQLRKMFSAIQSRLSVEQMQRETKQLRQLMQ